MIVPWGDHTIPNAHLYRNEIVLPYAESSLPRQTLILRRPRTGTRLPVILWLHGGGLTSEAREIPVEFYDGKRIVIEARYRLSQDTTPAEILNDAAQALVWTLHHAEQYGGSPDLCFYGGMSAGCYLAALTAFDRRWVQKYDAHLPQPAGLLLLSGQYSTHFRVKEMLYPECPNLLPMIDDYAPMKFLSAILPPMILISGEPGLDIPARPEENAYTAALLKAMGHPDVDYIRLAGCDHSSCLDRGGEHLVRFMDRIASLHSQQTPQKTEKILLRNA